MRRHVAPVLKLALSPTQIVTACGVSPAAVREGIASGALIVHDVRGKRRVWIGGPGGVEQWFKSFPLAKQKVSSHAV
ncbi:hypothetical protein HU230_0036755 [Bradyrhizobium quebecense]|uniref:Uncharacterized protein n=1 Tax=Bradyrhizobium quebecense TaxID=2748629 RepID=A0A974ADJ4_9BRAD|nr:hypothetical protein [Bradyrhizobium quebecense]UGA43740.1 hypothetical protein HU230_0036755 [Bradyrhizobium quebecense]